MTGPSGFLDPNRCPKVNWAVLPTGYAGDGWRPRIEFHTSNALIFLHRHVLLSDLGDMATTVRARHGRKLPIVLSIDEVRVVLEHLTDSRKLMMELIYGGGLRLGELVRLRIKDLDFDSQSITIHSGKGDKDRVTLLPRRPRMGLAVRLPLVEVGHGLREGDRTPLARLPSVETTMIYTYLLQTIAPEIRSPFDEL